MSWKTDIALVGALGVAGFLVYSYLQKPITAAVGAVASDIGIAASDISSVLTGTPQKGTPITPDQAQVPVTVIPGGKITIPSGETFTSTTTATAPTSVPVTMDDLWTNKKVFENPAGGEHNTITGAPTSGTAKSSPDTVTSSNAASFYNDLYKGNDTYAQVGSPVWNAAHGIK